MLRSGIHRVASRSLGMCGVIAGGKIPMRGVRTWVLLGFLTTVAVATVSVRSQAANSTSFIAGTGPVDPAGWVQLLPLLAKQDTVFGRFIAPGAPPASRPAEGACAPDMVDVEGEYCPYAQQRCLRWLDPETRLQCAEFEKTAESSRCAMAGQQKHFCMDRYEWPNRAGALPTYMASWREAKTSCESLGKRLCSDTEWTLACEGPDRLPYPYGNGYERDDRACNIDKPYIWPHPERIFDPKTQAQELAKLDQREPSGSRPACVSPYGVHDMVGNVDEWVVNVSQFGRPYASGLKGGYWGPVRTRCRPMTTAHDETFRYYQIGFRCCGEPCANEAGDAPVARL
jgi:sulfatase-modifying factor enzyme 1